MVSLTKPYLSSSLYVRICLVALLVSTSISWWITPDGWIADDSYFYLVIARNIAQSAESTFSGVIPTNGTHPLWLYMLSLWSVFIDAGGTGAPLLAPNFVVVLSALLLIATAGVLLLLARELDISDAIAVPPVIFVSFFGVLGSEAHLSLLALSMLCLTAAMAARTHTTLNGVMLGFAGVVATLARLDSVFAVFLVLSSVAWMERKTPLRALLPMAIVGVFVLGYLASNVAFFGGLMPVSGWMKSSFPHPSLNGWDIHGIGSTFAGVSLLFGWTSLVVGLVAVVKAPRPLGWLLRALWLGTLAKNLYIVVFTRSHTSWYWYYCLDVLLLSISIAVIASLVSWGPRYRLASCAAALVFVVLMPVRGAYKVRPANHPIRISQALIRENTSPGDTILVSDWPGSVAFHLPDRHIFAADLLTANRQWYGELTEAGDALAFITKTCRESAHPLTHLLWNGTRWLRPAHDDRSVVYHDPRGGPAEAPIGALDLPEGPIARTGKIRLWRVPGD